MIKNYCLFTNRLIGELQFYKNKNKNNKKEN